MVRMDASASGVTGQVQDPIPLEHGRIPLLFLLLPIVSSRQGSRGRSGRGSRADVGVAETVSQLAA